MFHIPVICAQRAERGRTRVSDTRFAVHFFAANAIINSALHCWALDAKRERLWKSLSARLNVLFSFARRSCALTRSTRWGISFSAPTAPPRWRLCGRQCAHDLATGYLEACRGSAQWSWRDLRLVSLEDRPDPEKFRKGIFAPTLLTE